MRRSKVANPEYRFEKPQREPIEKKSLDDFIEFIKGNGIKHIEIRLIRRLINLGTQTDQSGILGMFEYANVYFESGSILMRSPYFSETYLDGIHFHSERGKSDEQARRNLEKRGILSAVLGAGEILEEIPGLEIDICVEENRGIKKIEAKEIEELENEKKSKPFKAVEESAGR